MGRGTDLLTGTAEASERFSFFWSHRETAPFAACSQFYPRDIRIEGLTFTCCEQWMHWRKALLFQDPATAEAILATADPAEHKRLGRQVSGFSQPMWHAVARDIVFRANMAKFSQHPDLLASLDPSRGTTLVEAAPNDRLWGIGLAKDDPRAGKRAEWLGSNWLGEVVTSLRIALSGS